MSNNPKRINFAIALMAVLFALSSHGCGSGGGAVAESTKTWTIFVYGHGDHNLSGSLANDLNKMAAATIGDDINLVVATDWNAGEVRDSETGEKYPTGTEWYLVAGGGATSLLMTEAEQNLDEPTNLTNVISYAFENYPAERYGLIMWNHGGSWNGGYGGDVQDGTLDAPRGMTAVEVADAISSGLSAAGLTGTQPLDFLAFDTCLMGGAEVAYLMRGLAKTYIANAELDFGDGWNYTDTLTSLANNVNMTASEFAAMEVAAWETLHSSASYSDVLLRSHMAIDMTKFDDFVAASKALVDAILATASDGTFPDGGTLARAAALSIPIYGLDAAQKTESAQYRDFGQLLTRLVDSSLGDISTAAQAAKDALSAMQLGRDYGTLRDPAVAYELGFHIAMPEIDTLTDDLLSSYDTKAAAWSGATGWGTFLSDLAASNDPNDVPEVNFNVVNRTNVTFSTGSDTATFATMELVRDDSVTAGKQVSYGAVYFGTVTPDQVYSVPWDGNIWKVGTLSQTAAVLPWKYLANDLAVLAGNSNNLLGAYGQVIDGDGSQSADAILIFKADQPTADSIAFESSNGMWEVSSISDYLNDNPGSLFKPALLRWNWNSAEETSPLVFGSNMAETLPSSGQVAVQSAAADAGTYYLEATCENVWGNATTDEGQVVR